MVLQRIENVGTTDYSNQSTEFSVEVASLDSNSTNEENFYDVEFDKWNGYYKVIGEAKAIVDTLIKWTLGKGYKGEIEKLKRIVGNGKENALKVFKTIQKNAEICGDGFGEIIKDNSGRIINLKTLNSQGMRIITNKSGIIIRYEQWSNSAIITSWEPSEILHIIEGKVGDECHGHSIFESIENLIINRNEVISDLRIMFHRFVKPIRVWEAKTDNLSQIQSIATKIDTAFKTTENLVVPEETIKLAESSAIPTQTGGLSPIEYYRELIRTFISSCGVPEVVMGWGKDTTQASANIIYIAWQQTIEDKQKSFEDTIESQLKIKIELDFPIDISQQIQSNEQKNSQNTIKKSDFSPTQK